MTNIIYLNGKGAYRTNGSMTTARVKKADFVSLLNGLDEFSVILTASTAKKYAREINRRGFILTKCERYDMFDLCMTYMSYEKVAAFHARNFIKHPGLYF